MYLVEQEHLDRYMPKVKDGYFRNYHPDHIEHFKGFESYGASSMSIMDRKRHTNAQSKIGPTITAFIKETPVAIFGCCLLWRGVGEAWSLFDPKAKRYPIAMTKGAFAFFDICEILFSLHRIQITVKSDNERAKAWATYLGFVPEGLMIDYSADKEDHYIMRRS